MITVNGEDIKVWHQSKWKHLEVCLFDLYINKLKKKPGHSYTAGTG